MSAKRMKSNLPRKERGRNSSIPIPNFGGAQQQQRHSPVALPTIAQVPVTLNRERLLQLEAALRLYGNSQPVGYKFLPLQDFLRLAGKVAAGFVSVQQAQPAVQSEAPAELDLSTAERLLYDLLCATSPTLYKLTQVKRNILPAWKYSHRLEEQQDETMEWCLEMIESENRKQDFNNLIKQDTVHKSKSDNILKIICKHRVKSAPPAPSSAASDATAANDDTKPAATLEPFLLPGMTIDQRVRARADAKDRHRAALEGVAANNTSASAANSSTDPVLLVRLSDMLWSHANPILKRQTHSSRPNKTKQCALTLKDVVDVLSRPGASTSSRAVPVHATKGERLTKRQTVTAVQDLAKLVPEWIRIQDSDNVKGKKDHPSKSATVWIKSVDYSFVRNRLNGKPDKIPSARVAKRIPILPGASRAQVNGRPLNKRPLTTPATATGTMMQSKLITALSQDRSSAESLTKKTRVEVPTRKAAPFAAAAITSTSSTTTAGLKRPAASDDALTPPPQKKKRGLRINPNLILTDADYSGGEVIEPSLFESPRGLKSLFYQMNAGKRI